MSQFEHKTLKNKQCCFIILAQKYHLQALTLPMVPYSLLYWHLVWHTRLRTTAWGRHVFAVGDDPEAAELSGVNVKKTLISVYMLAGLICAFAGWAVIGRIGAVSPNVGQLGNIESITAVVIGGISFLVVEDRLQACFLALSLLEFFLWH